MWFASGRSVASLSAKQGGRRSSVAQNARASSAGIQPGFWGNGGHPYLPYRVQHEIPPEVPVNRASKHEPMPDRPGAWWPVPTPISTRSIWPCLSTLTPPPAFVARTNVRGWKHGDHHTDLAGDPECGGDYEHRLAHEARKSKPKQGEEQ